MKACLIALTDPGLDESMQRLADKGPGLADKGPGLADKGPGLAVSMSEKEDTVLVATTSDRGKNRDDSGSGSANIGFVVVVVVMGS